MTSQARCWRLMRYIVGGCWFLFIMLCGPLLGMRLGLVDARRIGHLSSFSQMALLHSHGSFSKSVGSRVVWEVLGPVCNVFLYQLIAKKLNVRRSFYGAGAAIGLMRRFDIRFASMTVAPRNYLGDHEDLRHGQEPFLSLEPEEVRSGWSLLGQRFGMQAGTPFVCLHVRDDTFCARIGSRVQPGLNRRNGDFEACRAGIERLLEFGYWVFLMGQHAHKTSSLVHKRFIDLQKFNLVGDFADVFLISQCSFYWSSGLSGLSEVATLFRKPIFFSGYAPMAQYPYNLEKSLVLPAQYLNREQGRLATLAEIVCHETRVVQKILSKVNHGHEHESNLFGDLINLHPGSEAVNFALKEFCEAVIFSEADESAFHALQRSYFETMPKINPTIFMRSRISEYTLQHFEVDLHQKTKATFYVQ